MIASHLDLKYAITKLNLSKTKDRQENFEKDANFKNVKNVNITSIKLEKKK